MTERSALVALGVGWWVDMLDAFGLHRRVLCVPTDDQFAEWGEQVLDDRRFADVARRRVERQRSRMVSTSTEPPAPPRPPAPRNPARRDRPTAPDPSIVDLDERRLAARRALRLVRRAASEDVPVTLASAAPAGRWTIPVDLGSQLAGAGLIVVADDGAVHLTAAGHQAATAV